MFEKVLVANRGEIALRVIRACKELGVRTMAVYSEADEQSLHVQFADEAICIGPAEGKQSYLRADMIFSAAEVGNVDAIHPGYGFLSENSTFAEQCRDCGITFIGPSPETIASTGDKSVARVIARRAKVPVVPGSDGVIDSEIEAKRIADGMGYPIIIKAACGGGGKGMRFVNNSVSFSKEYRVARTEAEKSFGNSSVYVEKYIEEPRHIEIQILADKHGKVIHLFERDCSIQRRYQKLIEEAPSPFLTPRLRNEMGRAAVRIAEKCDYSNAGTVEFIVDKYGNFYFIEMNARVQVEHGVTEEMTDIDIVKWQMLIAAGEKLTIDQKDVKIQRHAIECRINAEDPLHNFAPCPGEISFCYHPGGYGIRIDSHVYGGYRVPQYYDSLISKVIASGHTRDIAISRMHRALGEYIIRGIATTIPFSRAAMADQSFREGKFSTKFVEEFLVRTPVEAFRLANF
ncbi:MAG: acetyl-CoA carboxylase biotin carboxylase subunit [Puniceicoccales bacterium]|jgi:acetyl-CoA carboxylase biotin carboxylase subunit|nr:acetyl-CoA carboxylase biotin carboxylase subunit [Puniceicoccales bacterium]